MANNFLLWYRFQRVTARGYFDEAVEDEEELREMGGNNSVKDIFLTLATDFLTEAPALEHRFRNSYEKRDVSRINPNLLLKNILQNI